MHFSTCSIVRAFSFAKQRLELREGLLDWVQVRTVRWQEKQFRTRRSDRPPHGFAFVTAQVIHHHDVAWSQVPQPGTGSPRPESFRHRSGPSKTHGAMMPVATQIRDESQRLAMTVRHLANQPPALWRTVPCQARHIRFGPGLVDEDQPPGGDLVLMLLPQRRRRADVSAVLLAGAQNFFLKLRST